MIPWDDFCCCLLDDDEQSVVWVNRGLQLQLVQLERDLRPEVQVVVAVGDDDPHAVLHGLVKAGVVVLGATSPVDQQHLSRPNLDKMLSTSRLFFQDQPPDRRRAPEALCTGCSSRRTRRWSARRRWWWRRSGGRGGRPSPSRWCPRPGLPWPGHHCSPLPNTIDQKLKQLLDFSPWQVESTR